MKTIFGEGSVLVLCPHTDDEFGCGGTIAKLIAEGADVHYVAFSRCEESVPAGLPLDTLERECFSCTQRLGLKPASVRVLGYPVRRFPELRQDILEYLVKLNREIAPRLVLLPSSFDTHQDHNTIAVEGFRAFKHSSILGYELPQNLISFENSAFVSLTEEQIALKCEALSLYASQAFRPYASEEFIRSLAQVRGAQIKARYAEAFEVVRLIL